MLKCIFIRRKIYDYLKKSLSEIDRFKVENHLDHCNKCRQNLVQLKDILEVESHKKSPQPDAQFWHNFKIDLERKLNEKLVGPITLKPKLSYRLKPAFTYALTLIFILVLGNYLLKSSRSTSSRISQDEELVDEIETLYDLGEAVEFDYSDDPYMEELDLLYQLDEI